MVGAGSALSASGDLAQAEYHYQAAVRLAPECAGARYSYGAALAARRQYGQAERQVEIALRLRPEFPEALELAAKFRRKNWAEAARLFRASLRFNPGFDRAHLGLGTALVALKDLDGARRHLNLAAASENSAIRLEAGELLGELAPKR
jgi:tetratricopeptide (TPR) repeat protein